MTDGFVFYEFSSVVSNRNTVAYTYNNIGRERPKNRQTLIFKGVYADTGPLLNSQRLKSDHRA